jgi:hypothetical protein
LHFLQRKNTGRLRDMRRDPVYISRKATLPQKVRRLLHAGNYLRGLQRSKGHCRRFVCCMQFEYWSPIRSVCILCVPQLCSSSSRQDVRMLLLRARILRKLHELLRRLSQAILFRMQRRESILFHLRRGRRKIYRGVRIYSQKKQCSLYSVRSLSQSLLSHGTIPAIQRRRRKLQRRRSMGLAGRF